MRVYLVRMCACGPAASPPFLAIPSLLMQMQRTTLSRASLTLVHSSPGVPAERGARAGVRGLAARPVHNAVLTAILPSFPVLARGRSGGWSAETWLLTSPYVQTSHGARFNTALFLPQATARLTR